MVEPRWSRLYAIVIITLILSIIIMYAFAKAFA
jgi:hypothetical protein